MANIEGNIMNSSMVLLEGLGKVFGNVVAVADINLAIQEGEFITLLGPSGCGKTTVLRMIAGQETPSCGTITINGKDMLGVSANKRPVNMVFQSYALFPHMNVFENIAFGPSLRKEPREKIQRDVLKMLELVQLEGFEKRSVTQLSGGQSQRVALARALINQPKVLLLDEPLGALDLKLRQQMQLELKSLNRKIRTTFIYVTHDQEEALTMSDRIVVLNQGKIVQVGTPRQIYEKPNTSFVSNFVGATNLLKGKVIRTSKNDCEIDFEGIKLVAQFASPLVLGDKVYVSIRPDAIDVHQQYMQKENTFSARVCNAIFLGNLMRYELCLPNGQNLNVQTSQTDINGVYEMDSSVTVHLPIEKIVVLKD